MVQGHLKYIFPGRESQCSVCEALFAVGQEVVSQVSFVEGENKRCDFCAPCWDQAEKIEGAFWKSCIPERAKKERKLSVNEKATRLLKTFLTDDAEGARRSFAFVLAQYLERRLQLVPRKELRKKGADFYEIPESGEILEVARVPLTATQARSVQKDLEAMISSS